jgi:hypothetical protein
VHAGDLDDDETDPALGARRVIGNELPGNLSVLDHHRVVSR